MVKLGAVFEIPLEKGLFAYGQYVFKDLKMGPIVQVFDLFSESRIQVKELDFAKPLFPPIITGIIVAIRSGLWSVIGKREVKNFIYPNFVSAYYDQKTGKARTWFLWDGAKYIPLGSQLPEEFKRLEYLIVWSPSDVVRRIETGEYLFPYRELILNNEFMPHQPG